MRIRLHPDASAEIDAAAIRYERLNPGLGSEHLLEVSRGLTAIDLSPRTWSLLPKSRRVRRFSLSRFPYTVQNVVVRDEIRVLAVAHAARRPGYWRTRRFESSHDDDAPPR